MKMKGPNYTGVSTFIILDDLKTFFFSIFQLHECLAQLITENLNVKRWLFKLDDEFDGRGIAYCDVTEHLKCYTWALKEEKRYGDKWSKKWAQVFLQFFISREESELNLSASLLIHYDLLNI